MGKIYIFYRYITFILISIFILFVSHPVVAQTDTDNDGLPDTVEQNQLFGTQELLVNTHTVVQSSQSSVIMTGDKYLLVWASNGQDGSKSGLFASLFNIDGSQSGTEFQVNTYTSEDQTSPSISTNGTGYFVTWYSTYQDGNFSGVYGQLLDETANKVGTEFRINEYTTGQQLSPKVATNGNTYFVVWQTQYQDGSGSGIYGRLYDSNATPLGAEFQINSYTTSDQASPSIAYNGSRYCVAWASNGQDGDGYGVFAQIFDSNAVKIGSEFQINTYTTNYQYNVLITNKGDNFLAVWNSRGQDSDNGGVFGQLLDQNGTKIGSEFQINTYTADLQHPQSIVSNDEGYLVSWISRGQDGDLNGVYAQLLHADGSKRGNELRINTTTAGHQLYPIIIPVNDGYTAFWTGQLASTFFGIFTKHLGFTDIVNPDTDNDMLTDGNEVNLYGTSPLDNDSDGDLLSDADEVLTYDTSPLNSDTDGDTLTDGFEVSVGMNPKVNDLAGDQDNDGLTNAEEIQLGTDILKADTDNDGLSDFVEAKTYQIGPEFQINTFTLSSQHDPAVSSNGDGYFVTWTDNRQLNAGANIYGQFLDSSGLPEGNEILINTYTLSDQSAPSVASQGIGYNGYLVSWQSYDKPGGNNYDIYGQLFDENNQKDGAEFLINTYTADSQSTPLVTDNDFNYVVVWTSFNQDGFSEGVFGQRIAFNGVKQGLEFQINTYTPSIQMQPAVASSDNGFLVVWKSLQIYGAGFDIYGQFYAIDGTKLGSEFLVNTSTASSQSEVSVKSNGSIYLVAWSNPESDADSSTAVAGQFYSADGTPLGTEIRINTYTTADQTVPSIASDGDSFFVAWSSSGQDGDQTGVYGQMFSSTGENIGEEFLINAYTSGGQHSASVASDGEGYLVTWMSFEQDGYQGGIYGRLYKKSDPLNPDVDGDTIPDGIELNVYNTSPIDTDYDRDTLSDEYEVTHNLHPTEDDSAYDEDNDGANNIEEFIAGTNLFDADTDNDGLGDNQEINQLYGQTEFLVHSLSYYPVHEVESNGNGYVVAWREVAEPNLEIYAQFYDSMGEKIGSKQLVNTHIQSLQQDVDIASSGDGYLIAWTSLGQDGSHEGVYGQLFDETGTKTGQEFRINTTTSDIQRTPAVAGSKNGYLVTWEGKVNVLFAIYGQVYTQDGVKVGSEFQVNTADGISVVYPSVSSSDISFLVVWKRSGDLYGQILDQLGNKIGGQFKINTSDVYSDEIFLDSNGVSYLVAWTNTDKEISGQMLDTTGTKIGSEFQLILSSPLNQYVSSISSDGNRYLVTFVRNNNNGSDSGIFCQMLNDSGSKIGSEFQINSQSFFSQYASYVAYGSNAFLATWETLSEDRNSHNIFGKILSYPNPLVPDTDADTLSDGFEVHSIGTSPVTTDTDSDLLSDDFELYNGLHPIIHDSAFDEDNDRLNNYEEVLLGTNLFDSDTDHDLLDDYHEVRELGTNPLSTDTDNDSLGDYDELTSYNTNPLTFDSDNDGLPDDYELFNGLYPWINDAFWDADYDRLANMDEFLNNTDPQNPDSDFDSMNDGDELYAGMDPTDAGSLFAVVHIVPHEVEMIGGVVTISWNATELPDRFYRVYWRETGSLFWDPVDYPDFELDIMDNGNGTKSWTDYGFDPEMNAELPDDTLGREYRVVVYQ